LIKARYNFLFAKLTVIACYAPSEDARRSRICSMEKYIRPTPRHDVFMVAGDLKARVGGDNTERERTMGT